MTMDPAKMAEYRQTARRREAERRQELIARRRQSLALAREAAALLRRDFGASKVVLFGSLARNASLHARSDVDLAAWGLAEKDYLRAVGSLLDLGGAITIDLVRIEESTLAMRQTIEAEGIEL
jgi:uncharacterized protein